MKKRIIITIIVLIFITISSLYIINHNKSLATHSEENKGTLAIMVYDEATSSYIKQDAIPKGDYHINIDKTHCVSNSEIISYDNVNGTLTYKLETSDECYVYFDKGMAYVYTIPAQTNLAQGIMKQAGLVSIDKTWGIINENGYRYEGGGYRITDAYKDKYADLEELITYNKSDSGTITYLLDSDENVYSDLNFVIDAALSAGIIEQIPISNYICLESDGVCDEDGLFRIVGVFGKESHGIPETNLVKVIKENYIETMMFQTTNWELSPINTYLQNEYLDSISDYSKFIQSGITWYLGGPTAMNINVSTLYGLERDPNSVYSTYPATFRDGKIGLIYASDYMYAVLKENCSRDTLNYIGSTADFNAKQGYLLTNCSYENWIRTLKFPERNYSVSPAVYPWLWTITSWKNPSLNFAISSNGHLNNSGVQVSGAVNPSFYLKPDVYVTGGDGTKENPYTIGI